MLVEMTRQPLGAGGCFAVVSLDLRFGAPRALFLILVPAHVMGGVGGVGGVVLRDAALPHAVSTTPRWGIRQNRDETNLGFEKFLQPRILAELGRNSQSAPELAGSLGGISRPCQLTTNQIPCFYYMGGCQR